ncbi:hypothetical protein DV735_g3588, partial [Chaetothyriales sp. CBS 134920]
MSVSDPSDDSGTAVPPHEVLEQSLRREVVRTTKSGADVTVKRIRDASEKKLGLPEGFYKSHATWKDLSRTIIEDQVNNEDDAPGSPGWPVLAKSKPKTGKGIKRKSHEVDSDPPKKRKKRQAPKEEERGEPSSTASEDEEPKSSTKAAKASVEELDEDNRISDSDLSVLLDEEPTKKSTKKRPSKSKDSQDKPGQPKQARSKARAKEDLDADQTEIKRLQGWLVKCGIRKVWAKELSAYDSPKAKIKHLKDMLSQVGMTGRFSVEKANRIKEEREMAADIEAIKEGEERWGAGDQDEPDEGGRPVRKVVRGSQHLQFLSDDGEETD